MNIFRYRTDEDSSANVDRFLIEVERVMPLDQQKRELLKSQMIDIPRKDTRIKGSGWLLGYYSSAPPMIGRSLLAVLKDNFSDSEYELLSEQLSANLTKAVSAYEYLTELKMAEEGQTIRVVTGLPNEIPRLYKYFDI